MSLWEHPTQTTTGENYTEILMYILMSIKDTYILHEMKIKILKMEMNMKFWLIVKNLGIGRIEGTQDYKLKKLKDRS